MTKRMVADLEAKYAALGESIVNIHHAVAWYENSIREMDPLDTTFLHMCMLLEKSKNRLMKATMEYNNVQAEILQYQNSLDADREYVAVTFNTWMHELQRVQPYYIPFKTDVVLKNIEEIQ